MASEKFMAENDLRHFWSKLESRLSSKVDTSDSRLTLATLSKNGLLSSSDFSKLAGIEKNANNYVHPTSAGNKHIPSGGSAGQILRWSASGTAVWGNDVNTTYNNFTGASASVAGASGLVPAPAAGNNDEFLRGDGTWATPKDTTYSNATTSTAGLMSSQDKTKLDGIANNANNYVHPTTSGNKHIPSGGASGNALMWSADGTAQWATIQQSNVSGLTTALNGKLSTTGTAAAASKLATGRTFRTNLSSTTAASFDGSANNVHGVTGTLAIANGGTGATSAAAARTALGAAASNHTHDNATKETSGFMSNTDKAKLDGLNPDANVGGFVQFDADSDIPVEQRVSNTLYGRILVDYTS